MESGDTAYMSIMPLLLDMLRNVANTPGYHQLHVKAMECASPIGLLAISHARSLILSAQPLRLDVKFLSGCRVFVEPRQNTKVKGSNSD